MARLKNQKVFDQSRARLLELGVELIRTRSFQGIGISDILKLAEIPKGSFYHYFENKEAFGLQVAQFYHNEQMRVAKTILTDKEQECGQRLFNFFTMAADQFREREFKHGCLMCNLSTELADENKNFQLLLSQHWQEMSTEIAKCIEELGTEKLGLAHLSPMECADWLLNSWGGSLTRMKATGDPVPLQLFLKTIFVNKI
jgi:TetR/AcrR family transcriptional repressor of nem operon